MILKDSVNTAVSKMKISYKAYEWILKNKDSIEINDDCYKKHFSEAQQVFSAVDVLLRCFIIEKKIPMYKNSKKVFITEETDEQIFSTHEFCCGILTYNLENPDKQWLTDVDFSYFVGENKKARNLDEHLGIVSTLQDLYRVYFNLNVICNALDITTFTLHLEQNDNLFDYARFNDCMDEMCVDDRRYILLSDSLHNIERSLLETFLQIPWAIIFDFDGASSMGGLQSILEDTDYRGRFYASYPYSAFTVNSSIKFVCARIELCEDDLSRRFFAKKQDDNDNIRIPVIIDKIRDSIHNKATIVVTGQQTERVRDICKLIKSKFLETDIIFLTNQNDVPLLETTEKDEWEEFGNIASVNKFENSIFDALQSIDENKELFLGKVLKELEDENEKYIFHALDNTKLIVSDMERLHSKETYFEFLHMNIGNDMTQCNEWEFYHGDIAKWETIQGGYVEPLINANKVKAFEDEIKKNQSGSCYTIYHRPGYGGTTLGRVIAWDLHKDMPVLRLKEYDTIQELAKDIGDVYTYLLAKHRFLLLIDENDFTTKQMQELEKMILDSEYTVKALFVKRISQYDAKKKQKNFSSKSKNEIIFSVLEIGYRDALKRKCYHLLSERGQANFYQIREQQLSDNLQNQQFALIINLYLLEENFNLTNYVKKFLDKLGNDSDGEKNRKMFAFIAMGEYFSNLKIPTTYIARYMDADGKFPVRTIEERYDNFGGLFLKIKMSDTGSTGYGIKHYLIAQEMLRQILEYDQNGGTWQGKLPDLIKEYIDFLYLMIQGMSKIDDLIKNIISWLFTDKTKSRWYKDDEDVYESSFTSLLMELSEYRRIEVIDYLAEIFGSFIKNTIPQNQSREEYKLLAHIYAQRARIRSKSQRLIDDEESQNTELQAYMKETMDVIVSENICEYDLEHMLGMCYLEKAKRLKEKEGGQKGLYEDILDNISCSIERFNYAIWYGSPDYGIPCKIDAITTAISVIIKHYDIAEDKRIEKLNEMDVAKVYVDEGIKSIQDIDEYFLNIRARGIAEKRKDEFEQICFPDKASEFLQRLDNLESKLSNDDYDGHYMVSTMKVYAYEKKYYADEYRRSSLIKRALNGNKEAAKDAERVFLHLDKIVKMSKEHQVSYTTYNQWFEYAKYMQISLSRAYEQACNWKQAESDRQNIASQRNSLVRPCYYLFVIQLLRFCEGESISDKDVFNRKQDLYRQLSLARTNDVVQDWYSNRKGVGHLYSREWIDVKNVDATSDIAEVQGKVVYVDEENCNYGYLRIINPNAMNKWSRAPKGMLYNKDSDVYFSQMQSNIISKADRRPKKFKFGFAYNRMIASMNSLEKRNITETIVEDRGKVIAKEEEPKKITLGMQVECGGLQLKHGGVLATFSFAGQTCYARVPHIYVKQGGVDLPDRVVGVIIAMPSQTDVRYGIQPVIKADDDIWTYPNAIPFIPASTEVHFVPNEKNGNKFAGKVNGYMATIRIDLLNRTQLNMLSHAIKTKESVPAKMLNTNSQGTGYVLYM